MKNQTFLLTNYTTFSIKNTRILLVVFGLVALFFSTAEFLTSTDKTIRTNPFLAVMAINLIVIGTIGLSKKSKFSPKVKLTESQLILKDKIFSGQIVIPWNKIDQIELSSYKIVLHTNNITIPFTLDTTKENSIAIKKALREGGRLKNITVIGS